MERKNSVKGPENMSSEMSKLRIKAHVVRNRFFTIYPQGEL